MPKCEACYIPYSKEITCPNCGNEENKECDFIDLAAKSLDFNMACFESYIPGAWYTGCYSDHILSLLFNIFEAYRTENEQNLDFAAFAKNSVDAIKFGKQEYAHQHLMQITTAVYKKLKEDNKIS